MDDIRIPHGGRLCAALAVARQVNGVNVEGAAAPGVVLVLTGADAEAQGLGTLNCHVPPMAFGGRPRRPRHTPARDQVRCVGDPVAFVVAETLRQRRTPLR